MTQQEFEQLWEHELKDELQSLEGMRIKQKHSIIWGIGVAVAITILFI